MTTGVRIQRRPLEKPSTVGSSHGYQRFMRCRYSLASGGFRLLVPSDRAVICSAKLLRSYLLSDFIKRYINKLILLLLLILSQGKLTFSILFSDMTVHVSDVGLVSLSLSKRVQQV